jgi:hypothetical protein
VVPAAPHLSLHRIANLNFELIPFISVQHGGFQVSQVYRAGLIGLRILSYILQHILYLFLRRGARACLYLLRRPAASEEGAYS